MSSRKNEHARPGDLLQVIHAFVARSPDELSLSRGDRVELLEKDDDFGDGWYLGKHLQNGKTGLFPEVYTQPAPKPTLTGNFSSRSAPRTPITEPTSPQFPTLDTRQTDTTVGAAHQASSPISQDGTATSNDPAVPLSKTGTNSPVPPAPLQTLSSGSVPTVNGANRVPAPAVQRSIGMTMSGDVGSPVMNETLSVIDEHITDMNTPRSSTAAHDKRAANDSGSEYSSHLDQRMSYIHGEETDEEESALHTEAEVLTWSPERVAEYLEDVGVERRHCDVFKEQEINGEALLTMDQPTLFLKEFELGPVGPRLRTWAKIRNLQQEVKTAAGTHPQYSHEDSGSEISRNRSTSVGAVLPRIPSLSQAPGSRTPTRQSTSRISTPGLQPSGRVSQSSTPGPHAPQTRESTPPLGSSTSPLYPASQGHAHRPSAASVRSLHHNRRHSAIDSVSSPLSDQGDTLSPGTPAASGHKKEPSFDRSWTMGGAAPRSADSVRPSSSVFHAHSQSATGTNYEGPATTERDFSSLTAADLDRGYFSGGELDNRKSVRNVLRKREAQSPGGMGHSHAPSYASEASRKASVVAPQKRHSRIGSTESQQKAPIGMSSAAWAYYGQSHRKSHSQGKRNHTVPLLEPKKPLTINDSPTITKLEYGDSTSSSPKAPKSESSSVGRASPSPNTSGSFFRKTRITGLRAISDAITGGEKAHANDSTVVTASPIKESPLQSPTRTGSTTPTTATKSFEIDEAEKGKRTTTSSGTSTPIVAPRRRNKKTTSAYLRGLESKSPKEQIASCDYSGWMKKRSSNLMTTWKPRLFVLRGRRLSYYYSEFDTEEKGLIDISSHRVLPANDETITGLHATMTRATATPSSPDNATITTAAATDAAKESFIKDESGVFIFKLVPPRSGFSRGVNFTKPTVHYFAVDNIVQGRLWMAALMKATIDKDPDATVMSTYKDKTISLAKAMRRRERPPALMGSDDEKESQGSDKTDKKPDDKGLNISGLEEEKADSGVGGGETLPKVSTETASTKDKEEVAPPPNEKDDVEKP